MKYNLTVKDSFGYDLEVLQELPQKGDIFPTVIMVPGFHMDLHEYGLFDEISDALVKNGFQTFRFSFEGSGKSEGNFVDMTIEKQAQQLKDILKYVLKDRFTDTEKVGVYAQSFGTSTVTAALPLPEIKVLLFSATLPDPATKFEKWFNKQRGFEPEGISEIQRSDKRKTRIGPAFWTSLKKRNFLEDILGLTQPILFVHGGNDDKIRYWDIEQYYNSVVSPRKKLQVIEKSDHAFTGKYRPILLKLIADWFNETLHGISP